MGLQTTLSGAAVCAGVGLHTGERARMVLRPAPADTGVVFRRLDLAQQVSEIRLSPEAAADTRLGTTVANGRGADVRTVEHVLAAVAGMGLDNVFIDLDGPEAPAMDGSAAPFARVIARVGLDHLAAPRRVIRVLETVEVEHGEGWARFEPAPRAEIDVTIVFDDPAIGEQRAAFAVEPVGFLEQYAPARTFAFLSEVDSLREAGLAQGGSLENCVVLDGGEVVNDDGLRFVDEFARHKAIDALGDLALAGRPIVGRYVAVRPGHALNNAALRALMRATHAWTLDTPPAPEGRRVLPEARDSGSRRAVG